MSILDINKDTAFIIVGDEYTVEISTPAPMEEYRYRYYDDWDIFNDYWGLGKMVKAIKNEILNIPMEKFKTYTRYAQVKKILRKYMRTHPYNEKWELSSWCGAAPFDWQCMTIRLSGKRYMDEMFTNDMILLIKVDIFKNDRYEHPF